MSALHDARHLAACFGCGAAPGTDHDPGCKYGLQAEVVSLRAERDQLRRELERRESGVYGEMRDELVAELEKLEAERDRYRAALREAMELHRIAVVYVLAATPRTERTDYIDRLGVLEALTTSTQEDETE